jgi:hypothetical protein
MRLTLLVGFLLATGVSQAALVEDPARPGLVFDTTQGLIWLKNANPADDPTTVADEGIMTWDNAKAWAESLVVVSGGVTYSDWRLPGTPGTCTACVEGEWGGLKTLYGITSDNPGPFVNLSASDYWTDRESGDDSSNAFYFTLAPTYLGQYVVDKNHTGWDPHAWAVMVPEPETWAMLLAGLGLVGLVACRRGTDSHAIRA